MKPALIALLALLASGVAVAQQNSTPAAGQQSPEAIMQSYAAQNAGAEGANECLRFLPSSITGGPFSSADEQMKEGEYMLASPDYAGTAAAAARCAIGPKTPFGSRLSMRDAMQITGHGLAMSVIAGMHTASTSSYKTSMGHLPPSVVTDAENARVLLRLQPERNQALLAKLDAAGVFNQPAAVTAATAASGGTFTAKALVADYKANTFGFNTRYGNKSLQVTGPVQLVYGSGGHAHITLMGYMPANHDDQGFQDQVGCEVTDAGALAAAASLHPHEKVTVSGLYEPDAQAMKVGVDLQDCRVVQ